MDDWIDNISGECPVADGTLIDVRYNDGHIGRSIRAGRGQTQDKCRTGRCASNWTIMGCVSGISAYKLTVESTQKELVATKIEAAEAVLDSLKEELFEIETKERKALELEAAQALEKRLVELEAKAIKFYLRAKEDLSKELTSPWNREGKMDQYSGKVYSKEDVGQAGSGHFRLQEYPGWYWRKNVVVMLEGTWEDLVEYMKIK